jgi:prevent-host-death family protein
MIRVLLDTDHVSLHKRGHLPLRARLASLPQPALDRRRGDTPMKIASMAEVKAHLSAYVKVSEAELVVITRNGKPAAVLLPIGDDAELERLALAYSKRFQAILTEGRNQITATGGISHADFWHEIGGEDAGAERPHAASRHQTLRPNKGTLASRRARSEEKEKSPGNSPP